MACLLTAGPGADIAPYHDRQIVLLLPEEGAAWLDVEKVFSITA